MSWQDYVDTSLLGSGHFEQAAIMGHDGSMWAVSSNLNLQQDEAIKLISAFEDPSDIRANGLYLCGKKYFTLRTDERSISARQASIGVCAVKTGQAVLLGLYDGEKTQPGAATKCIEELADYLIGVGF